jgi:hypothetical protein
MSPLKLACSARQRGRTEARDPSAGTSRLRGWEWSATDERFRLRVIGPRVWNR